MTDEKRILERLQNRSCDSMEEAIEIYTPYLGTVLYNMLGTSLQKEDVEEIVSDVFVVLWKNADRIDLSKGTLRGYLAVTARNFALKKINANRETVPIDELDIPDKASSAEEKICNKSLWDSVMELGEPDNEIFVRYYRYGEKLRDIAKAMKINLSTIKTKLSRGKEKLKKMISDAEGTL